MTIAYAFLTKEPNETLMKFAENLQELHHMHVYIVVNDNSFLVPDSTKVKYIQIDANECRKHNICCTGDVHQNIHDKANTQVQAWDKALYYFLFKNTDYSHVWFIEDDVYINSYDALKYIDNKYPTADLLVAKNDISKDYEVAQNVWFWRNAVENYGFPAYCSMCCACRLSKELLQLVKEDAQKRGYVGMHEFSFNTIAMKNNLFHPMKNYDEHEKLRQIVANAI